MKILDMKQQYEAPTTLAQTLKVCDADVFPNSRVLLQIAATLPVTSCECERSFSSLRRLHSYVRASMGQERLSSLGLIHIHYDKIINLDDVVDTFAAMHPRRMRSLMCAFTNFG